MKIPASLPTTLRRLRLDKGLRLATLASLADLPPQRLCDYERGMRPCTESGLRRICQALGVGFDGIVAKTAWAPAPAGRPARPLEGLAMRSFCPEAPFLPERTRDFSFRLRGAWRFSPERMAQLLSILDRRQDLAALETFLRDFPADSSWEALFDLEVAALGAGPAMVSPARLGFHHHPVIDPLSRDYVGHRRRPALILPWNDSSVVFMPQVAVAIPGRYPILDYLVGVARAGHSCWSAVEVDGPTHAADRDRERDEALGLPVLRLEGGHLQSPRLGASLLEWLLQRHDLSRSTFKPSTSPIPVFQVG